MMAELQQALLPSGCQRSASTGYSVISAMPLLILGSRSTAWTQDCCLERAECSSWEGVISELRLVNKSKMGTTIMPLQPLILRTTSSKAPTVDDRHAQTVKLTFLPLGWNSLKEAIPGLPLLLPPPSQDLAPDPPQQSQDAEGVSRRTAALATVIPPSPPPPAPPTFPADRPPPSPASSHGPMAVGQGTLSKPRCPGLVPALFPVLGSRVEPCRL
eukprot:XP_017455042.1 PREDICTED: formin-like protein 7 isoform X1 [Rattus norvegicus]